MPRTCGCGGRFRSIDRTFITGKDKSGLFNIYDQKRINPGYASFKCDKCGNKAKQKLRISKK